MLALGDVTGSQCNESAGNRSWEVSFWEMITQKENPHSSNPQTLTQRRMPHIRWLTTGNNAWLMVNDGGHVFWFGFSGSPMEAAAIMQHLCGVRYVVWLFWEATVWSHSMPVTHKQHVSYYCLFDVHQTFQNVANVPECADTHHWTNNGSFYR